MLNEGFISDELTVWKRQQSLFSTSFTSSTTQHVCITFVWNVWFENCYIMIVSKVIFSIQKVSFETIYLI